MQIVHVVGKLSHMNHVRVTGIPQGASVSPVVGQIHPISRNYKIVNDFFIFFYGDVSGAFGGIRGKM